MNPVQSARLRTAETFAFKYGRVEVSAKMPKGDWLWPAIWLMPANGAYGAWPASGEIDLLESRGNANYPAAAGGGVDSFSSTMHWGPFWPLNGYQKTHEGYTLPAGDLSQAFHTYELDWSPTAMTTSIDGVPVLSVALNESFWQRGGWDASAGLDNPWQDGNINAPLCVARTRRDGRAWPLPSRTALTRSPSPLLRSDQRFYLIINIAVGGTNGYFPDGVGGKPWTDQSAHAANDFWARVEDWYPTWTSPMMVDYVRVYQRAGDGGDYAYKLML